MECFECNKIATENHHVIPKTLGGTKTIPLCGSCHAKVHQMDGKRRDSHSELTKLGLKRAKKRGVNLGNPNNMTNEGRKKGWKTNSAKAANNKNNLLAICFIKLNMELSLREIADKLNSNGYKTSRGSCFQATTVKRLINKINNLC